MQPGDTFTLTRVLAQSDFDRFAALSGDDNPIHIDPEFSARTRFGRTVAHGMFLYSLVCGTLAHYLPGVVQLDQNLMFPNPSYVGETVTVMLRVADVDTSKGTARIETTVTRPGGEIGLQGDMVVRV